MTPTCDTTHRIVVATEQRSDMAGRLVAALDASCVMDTQNRGALAGHRRALQLLGDAPGIILEDDAVPVPGFPRYATEWITRFPDRLASFYLGTGRPPQWQDHVTNALAVAVAEHRDFIELPTLIHGVCYYVPPGVAPRLLAAMGDEPAADYAIGAAWARADGRPVMYPAASFVEHDDRGTSYEAHPDGKPRTGKRHARELASW